MGTRSRGTRGAGARSRTLDGRNPTEIVFQAMYSIRIPSAQGPAAKTRSWPSRTLRARRRTWALILTPLETAKAPAAAPFPPATPAPPRSGALIRRYRKFAGFPTLNPPSASPQGQREIAHDRHGTHRLRLCVRPARLRLRQRVEWPLPRVRDME